MSNFAVSPNASRITLVQPVAKPQTLVGKQAHKEVKAESLSKTDAYVSSSVSGIDALAVNVFNSYGNSRSAIEHAAQTESAADYLEGVGGAVKRGVLRRGALSIARNGWAVYKDKISLAEAGGRVAGDLVTGAAANAVGAVASNLAVAGLSKAGVAGIPLVLGGMAASSAANWGTTKALQKTGVQTVITDHATELFKKAGVPH